MENFKVCNIKKKCSTSFVKLKFKHIIVYYFVHPFAFNIALKLCQHGFAFAEEPLFEERLIIADNV